MMIKKFIKKVLPTNLIWSLVSFNDSLRLVKIKIIKSNRLFVVLDLAFSTNYYREHKSYLEGAYNYEKSIKNNTINVSFLRRNIHRIEKGILMKPRRDVFALRFILPTVVAFSVLAKKTILDRSEYKWAYQVLREYFKIVKSNHGNYLKAFDIFDKFNSITPHIVKDKMIPYVISDNKSNIVYEDLLNFTKKRKSVRWYKKKEISNEIIEKALKIASLSPSSCNRLPYRYIVSNKDFNMTKKISDISAGTIGWSHNIPGIAVLVGKQSAFTNVSNRHSIYVDSTLSVMPFILALESLGLNTCLINWADIPARERKMNELLSLKKDEKVILSIAFGYADVSEKVAFSQRKYINEISDFIN